MALRGDSGGPDRLLATPPRRRPGAARAAYRPPAPRGPELPGLGPGVHLARLVVPRPAAARAPGVGHAVHDTPGDLRGTAPGAGRSGRRRGGHQRGPPGPVGGRESDRLPRQAAGPALRLRREPPFSGSPRQGSPDRHRRSVAPARLLATGRGGRTPEEEPEPKPSLPGHVRAGAPPARE